jgi:hypothetical protein
VNGEGIGEEGPQPLGIDYGRRAPVSAHERRTATLGRVEELLEVGASFAVAGENESRHSLILLPYLTYVTYLSGFIGASAR